MRLAGSQCRIPAVVAVVLATIVGVSASALMMTVGPLPSARAGVAPLTVSVDGVLSLVGETITLSVEGQVAESIIGSKLVISVKGPAEISQVGQSDAKLPLVAKIVRVLSANSTAAPSSASTTATTEAAELGAAADLAAGVLKAKVALPADTPADPGAYMLLVEVKTAGVVRASGLVWVGRAAPRDTPVDLAFVWPMSLGIHRDSAGVFYDQVLEEAVANTGTDTGDLFGLLGLAGRFSDWEYTLGVEPMLLTQLRDMADGYVGVDAAGQQIEVGEDDPVAKNAAQALATLKGLAGAGSVEVAVGSYASADLGALAAEGWRDGLEQIQMGKQELQQTLGLEAPPAGAFSPDLKLTADSLGYYAQASIDHVVVDAGMVELLAEPIEDGTIAVRACDTNNDRVTLIFANSGIGSLMTEPWDPGVFFAALAAELASGSKDAIVISPGVEFTIPPGPYLESIGEVLGEVDWLKTRTLSDLLRSHSPGTRPILLEAGSVGTQGYIAASLLAGLRTAHTAVTDLAAIADATRAPLEMAHRLLYAAESHWWSREGTSPQQATIGLTYAERAEEVAQGELDKVRLLGFGSGTILGREGEVTLLVENGADYPVTVEVRLTPDGLTFPDGEALVVELPPGQTEMSVRVASADGAHSMKAELVAGSTTLEEMSRSVRFVTVMGVLPWAILAVVVVLGVPIAASHRRLSNLWRRLRRHRAAEET